MSLNSLDIKVCFHQHHAAPCQTMQRTRYHKMHAMGWCTESRARTATVPMLDSQKRSLDTHLKKHWQVVFTGDSNMPALAEHTMTTGHELNRPNTTVLDSCQAIHKRLYLELWYIHKQQDTLRQTACMGLCHASTYLVEFKPSSQSNSSLPPPPPTCTDLQTCLPLFLSI